MDTQAYLEELWNENWGPAERIAKRLSEVVIEELGLGTNPTQVLAATVYNLLSFMQTAEDCQNKPDSFVQLETVARECLASMVVSMRKKPN